MEYFQMYLDMLDRKITAIESKLIILAHKAPRKIPITRNKVKNILKKKQL